MRLIAFSEALQLAPHYTDIGVDMGGGPFFKFKDLPECSPGKDNFIDIPSRPDTIPTHTATTPA